MKDTWREDLEAEFGKEIYITGYSGEVISSGSFIIDVLTGIGGFPLGHIVEIFGNEGCGKTTLALSTLKVALDKKRKVLFEDYEGTVSDLYLKRLDIKKEVISDYFITPHSMEEGWLLMKRFCEKKDHYGGLIIVDSLASMAPKFDLEKMSAIKDPIIGESKVGSMAQVMSISLREMTGVLLRSNVCLIFINQERANIDFTGRSSGKVTPGGNALKFYSSMRFQLQSRGSLTIGDKDDLSKFDKTIVTAIKINARLIKNKFGPSYRNGMLFIRMNEGIDNVQSAIDVALSGGKIKRRGPYYELDESYSGTDILGKRKISGLERTRQFFLGNLDIQEKLLQDARDALMKEENHE